MAISFDELVGWWQLHEAWHEFEIAPRRHPFGEATGSLVFTSDSRMMLVILATKGHQHAPGYDVEVYSGRCVLDGAELITKVDFSSNLHGVHREIKSCASLGQNGHLLCLTSRHVGPLYDGAPFDHASNWFRMRVP
jgi:hypothetical protein